MRFLRISTVAALGFVTTLAFATPASATQTLDQEYDSGFNALTIIHGAEQSAQVFTAGVTGPLNRIDLAVSNYGTSAAELTMTIKNVAADVPTGAALASSSVPRASTINNGSWVTFSLSTPINLVAGVQYAIILSTTEPNNNNGYGWATNNANPYAGGQKSDSTNSGSSWSVENGYFLGFRTYLYAPDVDETPPPVLQQFGMPSSGTCAASAPVVLNWGGAGSGDWGNSWAQWANGGKGGPVCTRTLVYSNSSSRWIVG
jgi:hypothetical protein